MATRVPTNAGTLPDDMIGDMYVITWSGLLNGDDGTPVRFSEFLDRSIQFTGIPGAGGTFSFQGSNDIDAPTNWFVLTDPQGNAITKTAAALEKISEPTVWVRPIVTAGDGTTSMVAKLFLLRRDYVR